MGGSWWGQGAFVGGPKDLLLGVMVAYTHYGVARGVGGGYWAAGLVQFQGEVQVDVEGKNRPAPSQEQSAQVGVP